MNKSKFKILVYIFLLVIFVSSCTKRTYISRDVVYSVDDNNSDVINGSANDLGNTAKYTDEYKVVESVTDFAQDYILRQYPCRLPSMIHIQRLGFLLDRTRQPTKKSG
jgi:hypothetical protein